MNEVGSGACWDGHVHVFEASTGARQGHYQPMDRPLAQIEALAASHGVHHLVLVQPSVYGADNSVLLRALGATPGRHRGVVVVDDDVPDTVLDAMHARGVRLNLVSPVGGREPYAELLPQVRRLAALFGERMVWGSDWPHTLFAPHAMPSYASNWQPVVQALGEAAADALRLRLPAIYR